MGTLVTDRLDRRIGQRLRLDADLNGGGTRSMHGHPAGWSGGYVVGVRPRAKVQLRAGDIDAHDKWVSRWRLTLSVDEFLGVRADPESTRLMFDVVRHVDARDEAMRLARMGGQTHVWCCTHEQAEEVA